jgi:hypothetical protein
MRTKSPAPVGSLHPVLFFAVVYMVALVLSIFICSSLFYSCNAGSTQISSRETKPQQTPAKPVVVVAMR